GQPVRAVGRDRARLGALAEQGAELCTAEAGDAAGLAKVFAGAQGAYLMIPPQVAAPDLLVASDAVSTAITEAVKVSGLSHAVVLSSIAAQHPEQTGPIVALHRFENKLKQVPGLSALFLRPAYFFENFLMMIPLVEAMGFFAGGI